MIVHVLQEHGL